MNEEQFKAWLEASLARVSDFRQRIIDYRNEAEKKWADADKTMREALFHGPRSETTGADDTGGGVGERPAAKDAPV
jgi:hypothetical protein